MAFNAGLLGASYVLAPDILLTSEGVQKNAVIAIHEGIIAAVGPRDVVRQGRTDWPVIELKRRAIIPGFIDSHTHAGQTFGKAVICGEPSQIWKRIWFPLEDALDEVRSYTAAKWMFLEALRGGYTTLVNFNNKNTLERNAAVHRAAEDAGMRFVSGVAATTEAKSADIIIERIERHADQCRQSKNVYPSLCFRFYPAAYANGASDGMTVAELQKLGAYCRDRKILLQMHSNEHFPDVHECEVSFGKRPIEVWNDVGILHEYTLLHHATLVSPAEIELLETVNAAISYNPVAAQWKGAAIAPALEYARRGIRMGLGTDGTRMDGFRTLDAAECSQRLVHGMPVLDFACGNGWTWVHAATTGAADAIGLGEVTGSLAPGLAADLLVVRTDGPEVNPSWDFEWELVRLYNRDQIEAVVVNGKPVMMDGKPVGWDADTFLADGAKIAAEMLSQIKITKTHRPSGYYRSNEGPASGK